MKIHEYQGQGDPRALRRAGSARRGRVLGAGSRRDRRAAWAAAAVVVKAQIHAGGRGKAGGVKVVKGPEEAERAAAELLGHDAGHLSDRPGRPGGRRACSSKKAWRSIASCT